MFKLPVSGYIKPLAIIWTRCGGGGGGGVSTSVRSSGAGGSSKAEHACGWTSKNTLHVDDLARNFELNKRNGVLCRPYYHSEERKEAKEARAVRKAEKEENKKREARGLKKVKKSDTSAGAVAGAASASSMFTMPGSTQSGFGAVQQGSSPPSGPPDMLSALPRGEAVGSGDDKDCELLLLGAYLCSPRVLGSADVTELDHSNWREAGGEKDA
jgi:hypothetical protein